MLERDVLANVRSALQEDLNSAIDLDADITAALIPASQRALAHIVSRETGVFCGRAWVDEVFQQLDQNVAIEWRVADGDVVESNQVLCVLQGNSRSILTGERSALNLLQTLSGTATTVHAYVQQLGSSKTKLLDTRKTLPGLRKAQKYAVTCGGGYNHRIGLYDAYLIKENHILACGGISASIALAREHHPDKLIEVEVESLEELQQAIDAKADIVMLDNFDVASMKAAVAMNQQRVKLEVSGNITLAQVADLAEIGMDYISVGALTKHVKALDLSLRILQTY
jgi:nicotinate-nucleotide pyrophosphorylase (carboxylating)